MRPTANIKGHTYNYIKKLHQGESNIKKKKNILKNQLSETGNEAQQ